MRQNIDFAALVRVALAQGRTTAELGRQIGLSQPTVSRLSRGVSTPGRALDAGLRLIEVVGGEVSLPADVMAEVGRSGSAEHPAPERNTTEAANAA